MIDWGKFVLRVAAGTRICAEGGEGILLENYPYEEKDHDRGDCSEWLCVQLFEDYFGSGMHYCLRLPHEMQYFIDNRWQTFMEIMR